MRGKRETFRVSAVTPMPGKVSGYHVINRDATVERYISADPEFNAAMDGAQTKFFFGYVDLLTRKLIFEEVAPWQIWK